MDFNETGFYPADILIPKDEYMEKWPVVACDQFTSEPEYWEKTKEIVSDAPSTLKMVLPEAKLNDPKVDDYIKSINSSMKEYMEEGIFTTLKDSYVYLERIQSDGEVRHGLIGMVDLDCYDFTPGSGALIRATEGTVLSRIPPRVRVRKDAPIELPHVMLLIDDPKETVIEPLTLSGDKMEKIYEVDLMQSGGHVKGFKVPDDMKGLVSKALERLASSEEMREKYNLSDIPPLLFAVGDGNHSLATAKQCYEDLKKILPENQWKSSLARYALVEVVNIHDKALKFEPIHRVLFNVDREAFMETFKKLHPGLYEGKGEGHVIEVVWEGHESFYTIPQPRVQLPVGTLQAVIDTFLESQEGEVDYIHGDDVTRRLGKEPGNMGFLLPPMGKDQLFKTVIADGVLPRKTFSMGHARDKRYYLEGRQIR